jgi:hypothetical protein
MTYSRMLQMCCTHFGAANSDHTQQIRSLVGPVEIIEVRYRKGGPSRPVLSVFDVLLQSASPN